jgi:hypothetical protein
VAVHLLTYKPMWRWWKYGVRKRIPATPQYETPEVRQALDTVIELIADGTEKSVPGGFHGLSLGALAASSWCSTAPRWRQGTTAASVRSA